jgi:hypothetical protein
MPTATAKPSKLIIRAYQVGFGDCFLLTFQYPKTKATADRERHVLVDFGSTGMQKRVTPSEQMLNVANDIKKRCGGKLHMVVATHRHKDHISGFATKKDKSGTGDIIASLKPDMVIQPWTEDPAAKDPKVHKTKKAAPSKGAKGLMPLDGNFQHLSSLSAMNSLAETVLRDITSLRSEDSNGRRRIQGLSDELLEQIEFLSEDNSLPNRSAVANLARMGKNHYVKLNTKLNVTRILPGIKLHVLGPPDLEQSAASILKQRSTDKDQFWMLQGAAQDFWNLQAATAELTPNSSSAVRLFPDADIYQEYFPSQTRWFVRQMEALRGQQLLGLVRILDKTMNNTSVILVFEVGQKKLLFPGDAQIENWSCALDKKNIARLLKDVTLYKVGHHGSRNATPKTLWNNFDHRGVKGTKNRLQTIISTMKKKHGHIKSHTEVPRRTLVDALLASSDYTTTETAAEQKELYVEVTISL